MVSHSLSLVDSGNELIDVLFLMESGNGWIELAIELMDVLFSTESGKGWIELAIEVAPIKGAMAKLVGLLDGAHKVTMLASSSLLF